MRRTGFSLIELLLTITIVGVLASIAVPKFRAVKRRAVATQIIGDFDVVRIAALSFYVDSGYFPKEAPAGTVPDNMGKYLPNTFLFKRADWTLDYEVYDVTSTKLLPSHQLVGVAAESADRALGESAVAMLGTGATISINGKITFFIAGM